MANVSSPGSPASSRSERRRVLAAALAGTTLEWYDFFVYGLAAALIFSEAFFPSGDPAVSTLTAFATFGAGFVVRPLGAIVIGHLGDRYGRKPMLMGTVLMMGFATVAIGLLPTYAAIGLWAPVLLVGLRLLQGFAVGGEWGGSALISVEHAPRNRRAFYGSFTQVAVPVAYVLSSAVFLALESSLSPDALREWGWRIPFLLSIVVVAISLFLRMHVNESPVFRETTRRQSVAKMPLIEVLKRHPKAVALTIAVTIATSTHSYLGKIYLLSYATQQVGVSTGDMLTATAVASALAILFVPAAAYLADRVGWRPVFLCGAAAMALWVVPTFLLINTGSFALILIAKIVAEVFGQAVYAPLAVILTDAFPPRVRYTGASLGYQTAAILGGGFAPFIAAALFAATREWSSVAIYYIAVCLVSFVAMLFLRTSQDPERSMPGPVPTTA